ncbi:helix-turn-helix domain-containing protein [Nonomuraea sp. B19D2]|uniref:helix-turn-helix domain-containing protein n=1 Tax=Nonomuraea sp. B19D2 TaxID=3159561 RepID=UPI0032DB4594
MDVSLRRELGAHLRAARELVSPEEAGLGGGGKRRTPGLRREEVAVLAGVSVAWYTWLEQGRATTTRQVLDAVCRVLRMDPAAHRHALALAGFLAEPPLAEPAVVPGEQTWALLESWESTPAALLDERLDILGGNAAYRRLWGDPGELPAERRNVLLLLAGPRVVAGEQLLRGLYQQFRADTGHAPGDGRAAAIVRLLLAERPDAAHWWRCRAVRDFAPVTVEVLPEGLRMTFSLLRPVADQGVYILTQTPADERSRAALAAAGAGRG